jgi:F-type H+-transporting ATPase subunit delta
MNRGPIIIRYAQAYFNLGKEKSMLERFYQDCRLLLSYCKEVKDFCVFLNSPVIKPSQKKAVFTNVFGKQLDPYTIRFLELVIERNRENHLKNILISFEELYKKEKGIKSVLLITAVPLEDSFKEKLIPLLEKEFKARIEMTTRVNKTIVGGLILKVDDKLLDSSITHQLKSLKKQILS